MSNRSRLLRLHKTIVHGLAGTPLRLALFSLVALVVRWTSLSNAWGMNNFRDAHYLLLHEEAARGTVLQFHQIPLWDPYYCGGVYSLGSPQTRYLSPTFLLSLLLGSWRAEPLIAFLLIIVGLEGAYRYARSRKASTLGAVAASSVFALSGLFAYSLKLGWSHFYGFELMPWVLLGTRQALRGSRLGLVIGAVSVACMVGFGGTYAAPLTLVFCAFECLEAALEAIPRWKRWRTIGLMALALALTGLGLAAFRLWPIAETLASAPRLLEDRPKNSWVEVLQLLFGKTSRSEGYYLVGVLCVPVALLALRRRRALPLLLLGGTAAWLATGYGTRPSPFVALRQIPIYGMLRYPERFLVFTALFLSVLAALGIHELEVQARRRRWLHWLQWTALGLLLWNGTLLARNHYTEQEQTGYVDPPQEILRDFKQARGNRWVAAFYPRMSRGSLSCFDDFDVPQSPLLRGDLPQEEYLADPTAGSVTRVSWSPNRIALAAELTKSTRLLVNQNYHPGWRSNAGQVVDAKGLLGVELPAGKHEITLRFLPNSALAGLLVSVLALLAVLWVLRERRRFGDSIAGQRDEVRLLAWTGVPVLCGALLFAAIRPSPRSPESYATLSGEPVVVSALPPTSTVLGTRFEEDIVLEGGRAHLDKSGVLPRIVVELDLRLPDHVPKGLGVFVHLESSKGKSLSLDHLRLSSAVTFEAAPKNVLVRDINAIELLDTPSGTWTVRAGFWKPRQAGKRLKVIESGKAVVHDHRVQIGTVMVP